MGAAVGSVSSPDDGSRRRLWPPLDHRDRVGSERHFHHHSVTATVVMQHPNVDGGVLGARGVNFQMPLPVFVKVVEAKGSYAAGSAGSSGGLIQAASGS